MARIRVYELAKELGIESKQVLAALQELGEFVRSASSLIEPPTERRVRTKLAGVYTLRDRSVHRPEKSARFAAPTAWPRAISTATGSKSRVQTVTVKDLAPLERLMAEHSEMGPRISVQSLAYLRMKAKEWARKWFTDRTAAPWLALRMSPEQARECVMLGISPEMMKLPFRMPGRALCGGTLTYRTALARGLCTIPEIGEEFMRTGRLQPIAGDPTSSG